MIFARLTLLVFALSVAACAGGQKAPRESGPSVKVSGEMGIGFSSGGYGRNRHP